MSLVLSSTLARGGLFCKFLCQFDSLLILNVTGETGLEVCPGREATTEYAMGDEWTPCNPQSGAITVNVGDALMYWSDDKLKVLIDG